MNCTPYSKSSGVAPAVFASAEHLFELVTKPFDSGVVDGFAVELGKFFEQLALRAVRLRGFHYNFYR